MAYALLITGIILIIYGLKSSSKDKDLSFEGTANIETDDNGMFDSVLQNSEVLRRLDVINDKIDMLNSAVGNMPHTGTDLSNEFSLTASIEEIDNRGASTVVNSDNTYIRELVKSRKTQLNIISEDISDINMRILRLKNEGMGIEEIASELGLMKGEVLLRLGMKK